MTALTVPKFNTYKLTTAKPEVLCELLVDFFTDVLAERQRVEDTWALLEETEGVHKPLNINKFAHSLGFPSANRMKQYCKDGDLSSEALDIIEYGRSLIESDLTESGLLNKYNPAILKTILSHNHGLLDRVDHTSSDGSMAPQGVLPPELSGLLDYLHDGREEPETAEEGS